MSAGKHAVARQVVGALEAEGVRFAFGMPGSHVLALYDAMADSRIRLISAAHENTSAFMAGMYGYLTGQPGVALLTAGPGTTNSITGVVQAFASSLPMVHITGDVPTRIGREAFHGVDRADFLHRMFADVTKMSTRIERAADIPAVLARAFQVARSGRPGPVHVDIPIDISEAALPGPLPYARLQPEHVRPSADLVAHVAERLARAERPVICACRGVLMHGAEDLLARLAAQLDAPVLTTAYGVGAFDQRSPLAMGMFSEYAQNGFAFDVVRKSDFLLLIGLRPDTLMTKLLAGLSQSDTAFVALDTPDAIRSDLWRGPIEACNTRLFLEALLAATAPVVRTAASELKASIREQKAAFAAGLEAFLAPHQASTPLHFGLVLQALAAQLEDDAIVVSGVGNHHIWARTMFAVRGRDSFIAEGSWGTMGSELGGGIAAKLAHPDRQVVVVTGDGSLLMTGCDFLTAAKERTNVLVVVLNDGRHGIIGGMQRQAYGRTVADDIGPANFAQLAVSLGGVGMRLGEPGDIRETLRRALAASKDGPVILDVTSDSSVPWPRRDRILELGRGAGRA